MLQAGLVFSCAVISACSDISAPALNSGTPSSGDADFSNYVAIGDSLTAGYADGALYLLGQQNSFPAILAQQFAEVGGGDFVQPLVDDNFGGLLFGGNPHPDFDNRFVLNTETESPERLEGTPTTEVTSLQTGAFNNMGVPGAKSFHLLAPNYGDFAGVLTDPATANPYFVRFASSITTSVITDAAAQVPSFYTLWIGNNDVLGFATSGGDDVDPDPITDPVAFDGYYAGVVGALTAANPAAKGVLINIPDVSTIPYFTTVPYNPVPLDQANADALNAAYADYNIGLEAAVAGSVISAEEAAQRTISFSEGQNAVVILDEDLTPIGGPETFLRQATADDLVVLPAASIIGTEAVPGDPATVIGLGVPLEDKDVLIPSEILAIDTARLAYNATIKAAADADPNLAFLDAAAIMEQLESSLSYGTGSISADFVTGGAFSLDGVHPTARGYAVIANSISDVINTSFNANVFAVNPGEYPTIFLK